MSERLPTERVAFVVIGTDNKILSIGTTDLAAFQATKLVNPNVYEVPIGMNFSLLSTFDPQTGTVLPP